MNSPLVSIFICTYNSSKTVIETLESIKSQTYRNIELIISDDDSKDDTVSICKNWVSANKDRFKRAHVITHSPNTGTSANANRAVSACQGEWVKGIGGDDKLLPDCIDDFVRYIYDNPNATIVFSKVVGFGNMEAAKKWPFSNVKRFFDAFTTRQFRIILSTQNFLPAASVYIKRSAWQDLDGFDESIPLIEDWPFWVKALANGCQFSFMDKETVGYRFSESSISQGIVPLREKYLESNQKASEFAKRSLKTIGFFYSYYYYTRKVLNLRIPGKNKAFRLLNLFNPAYYECRDTLLLFRRLRETTISE